MAGELAAQEAALDHLHGAGGRAARRRPVQVYFENPKVEQALRSEVRTTRSSSSGFGAARGCSDVERPLLEPGDVRGLDDREQLVFVAGHPPLRARKVRYDRREPFRSRATETPPDQAARVDTPGAPQHPWAGHHRRPAVKFEATATAGRCEVTVGFVRLGAPEFEVAAKIPL